MADLLGFLDLIERRLCLPDREEQVWALAQAAAGFSPVAG
jgi:hypothetical protein